MKFSWPFHFASFRLWPHYTRDSTWTNRHCFKYLSWCSSDDANSENNGKIISKLVYDFVYAIETMLLSRKRPRNVKKKSVFVTFTLMILTVCLGGLEGVYVEGWTFVESFYTWFATLSTLGYGDYVPGWSVLLQVEESSNPKSQLNLVLIIFISALSSMQALCAVADFLNLEQNLRKNSFCEIKHNIRTTTTTLQMSHHLAWFLWTVVWPFSSQITWAWNTNQGMILIVNSELLVNLLQCLERLLLLKRTILCLSKYQKLFKGLKLRDWRTLSKNSGCQNINAREKLFQPNFR